MKTRVSGTLRVPSARYVRPRSISEENTPHRISGRHTECAGYVGRRHTESAGYDRRGITLLEVLAAIGVLSVGLLGLAALLPIGLYTVGQATQADRAGQCGRAGLRDVVVRRMLDSNYWTKNPGNVPSFLIDPEGVARGTGNTLSTTAVLRIGLTYAKSTDAADAVFLATDDLLVPLPENLNPKQPVGRPLNLDGAGNPQALNYTGAYSWFASVTPQPAPASSATLFNVSVVVCFGRNFNADGEKAVTVSTFYDNGLGGGSLKLANPINDTGGTVGNIAVKENDWVALCNSNGLCCWYRVASIGDDSSYLTLIGPDWTPSGSDKLVALGGSVLGVYTTTVDLDTDPTWTN